MPSGERKHTYIYGLADPDDLAIRYIGQSLDPITRVSQHLFDYPEHIQNPKYIWITGLKQKGKRPVLMVFERVRIEDAQKIETEYIEKFKETIYNTRKEVRFIPANTNRRFLNKHSSNKQKESL